MLAVAPASWWGCRKATASCYGTSAVPAVQGETFGVGPVSGSGAGSISPPEIRDCAGSASHSRAVFVRHQHL